MNTIYSTRNDAIAQEIIAALNGRESEYDLEKIADEVLKPVNEGTTDYGWTLDETQDFWDIVESAEIINA